MEKLKALTQLFENVEIDEKQADAIKEFFTLFEASVGEKIKAEFEAQISTLNEELEKAKGSATSDEEATKALEQYKEDAKKVFEMLREDAGKAAELMLEDAKEEHAKQLADALDKLYEEIETRASEDFKTSPQFAALVNVIKAVTPLVVSDDKKALLEEIETLKKANEALQADNSGLSKKDIIANLVEGFSDEHKKTMIEFIEGSKTEDEIYERFNAIASFIESKSGKSGDAAPDTAAAKRRFKTKKELKKEEKKEEQLSEAATAIASATSGQPEPEQEIVSEENLELLGANLTGLSKASKQGLFWILKAKQAVSV